MDFEVKKCFGGVFGGVLRIHGVEGRSKHYFLVIHGSSLEIAGVEVGADGDVGILKD